MFGSVAYDAAIVLVAAGVGLVLEIFWRTGDMPIRERVHGLLFWPILILGGAVVEAGVNRFYKGIGGRPDVLDLGLPLWLHVIAIIALIDFLFYWMHRFEHRFLWRFHSMHHSIRNMSAVNSYHHWTEPLIGAAFMSVPVAMSGLGTPVAGAAFILAAQLQGYLIHSQTKLHLGPLRRVFVDGRYHRIHHSTDPAHHDRNFAALLPLWDWLFGTQYWPTKDEWPEIGLEEQPPRNIKQYLAWGMPKASVPVAAPASSPRKC